MIDGVLVVPLRQIPDERGRILHMLRSDAPHFTGFGEIYFSFVYPGVVKGWHLHRSMTLNYAVIRGTIKLAVYDERPASPSCRTVDEMYVGEGNYVLVQIPPGVWNGFKGVGTETAIVANCASEPHDPGEIVRLDPLRNHIPYDWRLQHR